MRAASAGALQGRVCTVIAAPAASDHLRRLCTGSCTRAAAHAPLRAARHFPPHVILDHVTPPVPPPPPAAHYADMPVTKGGAKLTSRQKEAFGLPGGDGKSGAASLLAEDADPATNKEGFLFWAEDLLPVRAAAACYLCRMIGDQPGVHCRCGLKRRGPAAGEGCRP